MAISLNLFHANPFIYGDSIRLLNKHNKRNGSYSHNMVEREASGGQYILDTFRRETQQLMERSEQLVSLMTHVCTGVCRALQEGLTSHCGVTCSCEDSADDFTDELQSYSARGRNNVPRFRNSVNYFSPSPVRSRCIWRRQQHHTTNKWKLLQDGPRGSGSGPPPHTRKPSKRKYSNTNVPSCTKPAVKPTSAIAVFILLVACLARVTESCSSRSTPKPRPSSPTLRPNVTFQTYACPPAYAAWFCLNGATCFTVKIQDAILYNCECAEGYMGPRCEFKDLDGSYLPARERVLLETASIAGGACIAIILVFLVLFATYVFVHKDRGKRNVYDSPYNDQNPLSDPSSQAPEYICTITPVRSTTSVHHQTQVTQEMGASSSSRNAEDSSPKKMYLVSGISACSFCTCEKRDLSGHVICIQHSKKFVIPAKVPKYV